MKAPAESKMFSWEEMGGMFASDKSDKELRDEYRNQLIVFGESFRKDGKATLLSGNLMILKMVFIQQNMN